MQQCDDPVCNEPLINPVSFEEIRAWWKGLYVLHLLFCGSAVSVTPVPLQDSQGTAGVPAPYTGSMKDSIIMMQEHDTVVRDGLQVPGPRNRAAIFTSLS